MSTKKPKNAPRMARSALSSCAAAVAATVRSSLSLVVVRIRCPRRRAGARRGACGPRRHGRGAACSAQTAWAAPLTGVGTPWSSARPRAMPRSLRYWPSVKREPKRPGQHLAADLLAHRVRRAGAAVDAVDEALGIEPRPDPHRERLRRGGEVRRRQHVVDRLRGVAVAGTVADVHERRAELLEQRPRALHERGRAAEHDRQRARLGAGDAAADRRVEQRGAALGRRRGQRLRRRRARARHLEPERAVVQAGEQPLRARAPRARRPAGRGAS